jgi:hypothetical protein
MIRKLFGPMFAVLGTAALLIPLERYAQATPMPGAVQAALCGATQSDPPPQPTGHKCDREKSCKACFFSAGRCWSCTFDVKYKLCGTKFSTVCDNDTDTFDCGVAKEHQTAGSESECGTCIGGGSGNGDCQKNTCEAQTP